jgi:hypothetical protein
MKMPNRIRVGGIACAFAVLVGFAHAQQPAEPTQPAQQPAQNMGAKFQATYVFQEKQPFDAAYSGPHSLSTDRERSYSFTATAGLGARPWSGGEVYVNPEVAAGLPLSNLTGLGGFTNGEIARTSGRDPTFYFARAFVRQTWGLGGGAETLDSDMNQLAGSVDRRRVVLTVGKLSVTDLFDGNAYNHDPRTQFLNWSLMTHGAWDFAADARGYTWGVALEYYRDDWAVRAGRFLMPKESNGLELNPQIFVSFGDQIEVEHAHQLLGRPGKLRLLAYRNQADMGSYRDALEQAQGGTPDITTTRQRRVKYGFGVNLEQALSAAVGLFARASWNDGESEEFAFTEIDRSVQAGVQVKGTDWRRPDDALGIAFVRNEISQPHRDYLAAGGLGFFLGDGALSYQPEYVFESYYSINVASGAFVSLNFQRIVNPGYNADRRGPVDVFSVRLHYEL